MDIVDITFNFDMYREVVQNALREFNEVLDDVMMLKDIWDASEECADFNKIDPGIKFYLEERFNADEDEYSRAYECAREDMKMDIIEAVADLKVKNKTYNNCVNMYMALMCARVEYITSHNTQEQIYANYKLRTEWQDLQREIKRQENMKESINKTTEMYSLDLFGFEIDEDYYEYGPDNDESYGDEPVEE